MSAFLKYKMIKIYFVSLIVSMMATQSLAQCTIIKSSKSNLTTIETPENQQYSRLNDKYHEILIKTIVLKKPSGNFYYANITYTGEVSANNPSALIFGFENGSTVSGKVRFVKSKKIDNVKLSAKTYVFELKDSDLIELKQNRLKEVNIIKKNSSVTIPVNDPLFMQEQITCIQSALNNE